MKKCKCIIFKQKHAHTFFLEISRLIFNIYFNEITTSKNNHRIGWVKSAKSFGIKLIGTYYFIIVCSTGIQTSIDFSQKHSHDFSWKPQQHYSDKKERIIVLHQNNVNKCKTLWTTPSQKCTHTEKLDMIPCSCRKSCTHLSSNACSTAANAQTAG